MFCYDDLFIIRDYECSEEGKLSKLKVSRMEIELRKSCGFKFCIAVSWVRIKIDRMTSHVLTRGNVS